MSNKKEEKHPIMQDFDNFMGLVNEWLSFTSGMYPFKLIKLTLSDYENKEDLIDLNAILEVEFKTIESLKIIQKRLRDFLRKYYSIYTFNCIEKYQTKALFSLFRKQRVHTYKDFESLEIKNKELKELINN